MQCIGGCVCVCVCVCVRARARARARARVCVCVCVLQLFFGFHCTGWVIMYLTFYIRMYVHASRAVYCVDTS